MANIPLPDYDILWAEGGDILKPSDSKIQQGWQVEIPPRQWFNWLDNRQDQALGHVIQHGIAEWSDVIEYQANTSYVTGSDGNVYKCLITNTNVNPVGDLTSSWRIAFKDYAAAIGPAVATAAQSRAQTDNTVFISPLQLANAFTGGNQSLTANGFQKLPGGLILQWGSVSGGTGAGVYDATVNFPTPFASTCFFVGGNAGDSSYVEGNEWVVHTWILSTAQFHIQINPTSAASGVRNAKWFAIGI